VILGAEQRGASQLTVLRELASQEPKVPLLAVAACGDGREVRALLAAGAAGVVTQRELRAALLPCLRALLVGQSCVPAGQAAQLTPAPLSVREKQILGMVVMGCMNSEIAQRLFLAESTVKSHLHSAFCKLGVRSRNEAVSAILDPGRGLGPGILTIAAEPVLPA
jgi:DNA-binding NarL/FixJ family response regulator